MRLTADEKSKIYSLLTNIKDNMEYIEFYYINNFKDVINQHISEINKFSIIQKTEEDDRACAIWKLTEILEKRATHNEFINKTQEYYNRFFELQSWFDQNPLIKCKLQNTIDLMKKAFSYVYIDDGLGLENECFETGIIHLHTHYLTMHNIVTDFIKKISKTKCKRENIFSNIFKKNNMQNEVNEEIFINQLIKSCFKLQEEKTYFKDSSIDNYDLENKRNRFIRTLLDEKGQIFNYVVKDQTQRGQSKNENAPGEIDFLVETNNTNFTIIEALNLNDSFDKTYLKAHEKKLKIQYDKVGNKFNIILVYADVSDFDSFQQKYFQYLTDNYKVNPECYNTNKINSVGYIIKIKHFLKTQKLYHLVFKIG